MIRTLGRLGLVTLAAGYVGAGVASALEFREEDPPNPHNQISWRLAAGLGALWPFAIMVGSVEVLRERWADR